MDEDNKSNLLFLSQKVKKERFIFEENNLIISPTGSGKTTFIREHLAPSFDGKKILLVSTSMLEDELSLEEGIYRERDLIKSNVNLNDESIILMTYASFGRKILFSDSYIEDINVIFCDEIHSLFDYAIKHKSAEYFAVIKTLFRQHKDKSIFHFTATESMINDFSERYNVNVLKNVKVFRLIGEDMMRYTDIYVEKFSDENGLLRIIDKSGEKLKLGKKGFIYNERISQMKNIEKRLKERGYSSISIWSKNNKDSPMNKEQLRVREILINEKVIPDPYDFIIVNGAMREGWNLKDPDVEIAILNTLDETGKEQARGRARKDLSVVAYRTASEKLSLNDEIMKRIIDLKISERYFNIELDNQLKDELIKEIGVYRKRNELARWNSIKRTLESYGHIVESKRITTENGRQTVSIIKKSLL